MGSVDNYTVMFDKDQVLDGNQFKVNAEEALSKYKETLIVVEGCIRIAVRRALFTTGNMADSRMLINEAEVLMKHAKIYHKEHCMFMLKHLCCKENKMLILKTEVFDLSSKLTEKLKKMNDGSRFLDKDTIKNAWSANMFYSYVDPYSFDSSMCDNLMEKLEFQIKRLHRAVFNKETYKRDSFDELDNLYRMTQYDAIMVRLLEIKRVVCSKN